MLMYEALLHLHLTRHQLWSKVKAPTKEQLAILHKHMKTSKETLSVAHTKLESDPPLGAVIANWFEDVKGSVIANYYLDSMTMVEVLMMNVDATHICIYEE